MITFFAEKSGALFDFACFENRRWEYCVFLEKEKAPVCQFL